MENLSFKFSKTQGATCIDRSILVEQQSGQTFEKTLQFSISEKEEITSYVAKGKLIAKGVGT